MKMNPENDPHPITALFRNDVGRVHYCPPFISHANLRGEPAQCGDHYYVVIDKPMTDNLYTEAEFAVCTDKGAAIAVLESATEEMNMSGLASARMFGRMCEGAVHLQKHGIPVSIKPLAAGR